MLNMPCDQITELISQAQDVRLSRTRRFVVMVHLVYCKACRRFRKQLAILRDATSRLSDPLSVETLPADLPGLSDEARDRIKRSLKN
jgi:predicted anti-sigma-YlaC factor YlaD